MQQLKVYQSLWAMEQRHPTKKEPSDKHNFKKIKDAGFSGATIDLAAHEIKAFQAKKQHFVENNLGCMVNAFPYKAEDLDPILSLAKEFDACFVNIIGGVMPIDYKDAVPLVYHWMEAADKANIKILFETHRDSLLNDLYYTLQLIDAVPEMRLCADLSHFVVDREMWTPISESDQQYITTILERSDCFQGRVATREQIQIQLNFPQHQVWVDIFKKWWAEGIQKWKERNKDDETLYFLCELGPPGYAITDAKQLELSDRWQEALIIKSWIETIWKNFESND
jgi:hypothetical protein|tara:strand:- start:2073 stop:2918 length:846 start_codon:yes stop_codon:yes gene_type:complete